MESFPEDVFLHAGEYVEYYSAASGVYDFEGGDEIEKADEAQEEERPPPHGHAREKPSHRDLLASFDAFLFNRRPPAEQPYKQRN